MKAATVQATCLQPAQHRIMQYTIRFKSDLNDHIMNASMTILNRQSSCNFLGPMAILTKSANCSIICLDIKP